MHEMEGNSGPICRQLAFADPRFSIEAINELRGLFPYGRIERIARQGMFIVEHAQPADASNAIFIDFLLCIEIEKEFNGYDDTAKALAGMLGNEKEKSFKLEVKKYGIKANESAKDIEVRLGSALEAMGFRADLENPYAIVYVVFAGKRLFAGRKASKNAYALDAFRKSNKSAGMMLNRAEFKIIEAIDFFGISLKNVHKVLDIGAAPGGWTHYLSNYAKVVAVDSALLDYNRISKKILIIAEADEVERLKMLEKVHSNVKVAESEDGYENFDIVHIKASQKASMPLIQKMGKFDMLCIDINAAAEESASIAEALYEYMNPNAALIMTVKLVTMDVERHIRAAKDKLAHYSSIKVKKLPHNRREVTVFAIANADRDR